ncbi:hypothetical protein [Lachnoclostridium sp.]|uniref:hypothetical protein n=1 Tax=Lachnoclostridium sp. TaxID=2028282 RepID=UPI00289712D6|nr:hypothetical protein [Lachnoclostridium sp.]
MNSLKCTSNCRYIDMPLCCKDCYARDTCNHHCSNENSNVCNCRIDSCKSIEVEAINHNIGKS